MQNRGLALTFMWIFSLVFFNTPMAQAMPYSAEYAQANRVYFLLSTRPLLPTNPQYASLIELAKKGDLNGIAKVAVQEEGFLSKMARFWAIRYLSAEKETQMEMNDSLAMILGVVNDGRSAQELLTEDFSYGLAPIYGGKQPVPNNNADFVVMDQNRNTRLEKLLYRYPSQWNTQRFKQNAGLLTSRYWGEQQYSAGTNRRPIKASFDVFECKAIESWKTSFQITDYIRRDIPRNPSGDVRIFQNECRSCHSSMDALAGAFAYLDFTGTEITYSDRVLDKYNQHGDVYPEGYQTMDDSFENLLTARDHLDFGWRGMTSGKGVKEFGKMIANSKGFSRCIAKRTVNFLCGKDLPLMNAEIESLSDQFEGADQYRLKEFFIRVATSKMCQ